MNARNLLLLALWIIATLTGLIPARLLAACDGGQDDEIVVTIPREVAVAIPDSLEALLPESITVLVSGDPEGLLMALDEQDQESGSPRQKTKKLVVKVEDRPRLGLLLKMDRDAETDGVGAFVQGVTPGSPADEAGLKVGDIVTRFNGQSLTAGASDADGDESAPAGRLRDLASKLKEGDKVTLDYRRGSQTHSATLVARKLHPQAKVWSKDLDWDFDPDDLGEWTDLAGRGFFLDALGRGWMDLEMVPLNPDLGEYFGTSEGLLVVQTPEKGQVELRAGDIIVKIGDRKPATASQAFRILRSYEAGETVNLEIFRKHRKETLTLKVPERKKGDPEFEKYFFEAPAAPPAPPSPPSPPKPAHRTAGLRG